ncbi:hypothetical protein OV079_08900 [Nannocystis pusilla]|uniref:Uncharacterized protein n=1 Tax=Nannocystis pusilla TaxID=889268 RepID=A0A9X3IVR9_9BACT|nr:hypothetical protein [Nannocystis pusilla]MCY1005681.1 hypothetical protein [Nannocystis pusilla]
MRTMIFHVFAIGLAAAPLAAHAAPAAGEASERAEDRRTPNERILGALTLPLKAQALRKSGVGEGEVKAGLKAAKAKKLAAGDAAELLDEAAKATRDHGPVENFGAFVQAKLDAGLRGRDLAAAIREEHAAHGKGKGKSEGKGPPEGKGPAEAKIDGPPHGGPAEGKGRASEARTTRDRTRAGPRARGPTTRARRARRPRRAMRRTTRGRTPRARRRARVRATRSRRARPPTRRAPRTRSTASRTRRPSRRPRASRATGAAAETPVSRDRKQGEEAEPESAGK